MAKGLLLHQRCRRYIRRFGRRPRMSTQGRQRLESALVVIGDLLGIFTGGDQARSDQHDEFGASPHLGRRTKQPAQDGYIAQERNARRGVGVLLLDHTAEQHGLAILHAKLGSDLAL